MRRKSAGWNWRRWWRGEDVGFGRVESNRTTNGGLALHRLICQTNAVYLISLLEYARFDGVPDMQVVCGQPLHFGPRAAPCTRCGCPMIIICTECISSAAVLISGSRYGNLCRESSGRPAVTLEQCSAVSSIWSDSTCDKGVCAGFRASANEEQQQRTEGRSHLPKLLLGVTGSTSAFHQSQPSWLIKSPPKTQRRPVLDTGLGYFPALPSGPPSAGYHWPQRSCQAGLSASISANFHSRRHFLTSFSRAMAGSISLCRSA